MGSSRKLDRKATGLMIVDVQERLFPHIKQGKVAVKGMKLMIEAAKILGVPILVTEQYPQGLGPTVKPLKKCLPDDQIYLSKTAFSVMDDTDIRERLLATPVKQWMVIGIEAHVCVLQSALDLAAGGFEPVVIRDAIGSRAPSDHESALDELRANDIRVTSAETVIFELLSNSKDDDFKAISQLLQ